MWAYGDGDGVAVSCRVQSRGICIMLMPGEEMGLAIHPIYL